MKKILAIVVTLTFLLIVSLKVFAGPSTTLATATVVKTPVLGLALDAREKKTMIEGTLFVDIKAASSSDVRVYMIIPQLTYQNGTMVSSSVSKKSFDVVSGAVKETASASLGNKTLYKIKAGQTARFKVTIRDNSELLFGGVYMMSLNSILLATPHVDGTYDVLSLSVPPTPPNPVVVVGEKGPYVSSITPLQGQGASSTVVVSGVRFGTTSAENSIYINGVKKGGVSSTDTRTLHIPTFWFSGSSYYSVQIVNPKYGRSNFVYVEGVASTTTPTTETGTSSVNISATCPTTQFNRNLIVGSSGDDVAALQNFLYSKGYSAMSATGYFGPSTKSSLAAYQVANGINSDSYFDIVTRSLMTSQCVGTTTPVVTSGISPSSTKANLTINGVKDITLKVGDSVSYAWSSEHADKFTSSYTANCIKGTYEWRAKTAQGTHKLKLGKTNSGCTYNIVYRAINSKTKMVATDSIILRVSK